MGSSLNYVFGASSALQIHLILETAIKRNKCLEVKERGSIYMLMCVGVGGCVGGCGVGVASQDILKCGVCISRARFFSRGRVK